MPPFSQLRRALHSGRPYLQATLAEGRGFDKFNAFINVPPAERSPTAQTLAQDGPLAGQSVAVKDNICTFDMPTTCGSKGLDNYLSPYDATVVVKLREAGAVIAGKTNLDEFGMGSHSQHSAYGPVLTPTSRSPGGSSGGSAVAVAAGLCQGALGTDTGGSVRLPAAYNGIFGFKPSYGRISRWGVVAYANSLDTVGFMARDVQTIKSMFDVTNHHDEKDPTSLPVSVRQRLTKTTTSRDSQKSLRIGIPKEYMVAGTDPGIWKTWMNTLTTLQNQGHTIHTVSLPTTPHALSAYYILAPAEASSNLAKYDGVRYGSSLPQEEVSSDVLFANTRHASFGPEVRKRILLGAYSLSAAAIDNYFIKAQKIRRMVQRDFDDVFRFPNVLTSEGGDVRDEGVDALICPTSHAKPPSLDQVRQSLSPLDAYLADVFTVPASLAGLPAISVPARAETVDGNDEAGLTSYGLQVITQYGDDYQALRIANMLDEAGVCQVWDTKDVRI